MLLLPVPNFLRLLSPLVCPAEESRGPKSPHAPSIFVLPVVA